MLVVRSFKRHVPVFLFIPSVGGMEEEEIGPMIINGLGSLANMSALATLNLKPLNPKA